MTGNNKSGAGDTLEIPSGDALLTSLVGNAKRKVADLVSAGKTAGPQGLPYPFSPFDRIAAGSSGMNPDCWPRGPTGNEPPPADVDRTRRACRCPLSAAPDPAFCRCPWNLSLALQSRIRRTGTAPVGRGRVRLQHQLTGAETRDSGVGPREVPWPAFEVRIPTQAALPPGGRRFPRR